MEKEFVKGEVFVQRDFAAEGLPAREFEGCTFQKCIFAGGKIYGRQFLGCTFTGCDLSNADLSGTVFNEVSFEGCKMLGLAWEKCNPIGLDVRFRECILDHCSFYKVKMPKTSFAGCRLREADFSEADFHECDFSGCDLSRSVFSGTNLEKADLRTAHGYSIDPHANRVKKARFSLMGLPGLLDMYGIIVE